MQNNCEHVNEKIEARVCKHFLHTDEEYLDYARSFTGEGMRSDYLCLNCLKQKDACSDIELVPICNQCLEERVEDYGDPECMRGCPEILISDQSFELIIDRLPLPRELGVVVDAIPHHHSSRHDWLVLSQDGILHRLDSNQMTSEHVAQNCLRKEPSHEPWCNHKINPRLCTSSCGTYAAVTNDYGQFGCVIDIQSGYTTMDLDGGKYHSRTVPFSIAFSERGGECVVIHRTDWNRLDFSNPATGELLSDRSPTSYTNDDQRPEHYLDYFHGRLHVSPSGKHIADDGWVWSPVGIPITWQLSEWLEVNVWESEDGPTQQSCVQRSYYWDCPMVWIDDARLAVGGIGVDDEEMIPGVRIFDVSYASDSSSRWRCAKEVKSFAGPKGKFFSDGVHLYSADIEGLSRWDAESGVRTGFTAGFVPSAFFCNSRVFSGIQDGSIVSARIPIP
ncbi:MAG: hypothetical protein AB8C95_15425 [Phycisphaeraceae bacterium]